MRREVADLHVQHCGQPAQPLGADAERIDLFPNLQTQFFQTIGRSATLQVLQVDRLHQRFLSQNHGLLRAATDADS
jgi:hypothetical protein